MEQGQQQVDLTHLLPDDVLADVLRLLPPRSLAASRCVCASWRALIDGGGMLRADLLPRALAGLVVSYNDVKYVEFLGRPGADPDLAANMSCGSVEDHCNGLLLQYSRVLNPATDWCAVLPQRPAAPPRDAKMYHHLFEKGYLVFDPAVSPHYEVFRVPKTRFPGDATRIESALLRSEWPPSPWILAVFSSATGLWEERSFVRQGRPAGTVADIQRCRECHELDGKKGEYWRGALYVHCGTNFIIRISLSDRSYRVIENPIGFQDDYFFLGRSEKGIYYALLDRKPRRLRVWILDESSDDQIGWKLRHDIGPPLVIPSPTCDDSAPWTFSNFNFDDGDDYYESDDKSEDEEAQVEQEFEWNSDDDSVILPIGDTTVEECHHECPGILAFHPYKEIVFFGTNSSRVFAYHLSSSRLEYLGKLLKLNYNEEYMISCFPYTPCWMEELPKKF